MNDQLKHYAGKLACETGSWDLKTALEAGDNLAVTPT